MSDDCAKTYQEYGGQSVSSAGILGALQGISGLVGLSGFWNPVSNNAISNITSDFDNIKAKLSAWQSYYANQITADQQEFANEQLQLLQSIEDFHDELLDEKITKNSLMIAIIFGLLIIVIIYLIVL
jgi:hypothetical protein